MILAPIPVAGECQDPRGSSNTMRTIFALVGDVHGHIHAMHRQLRKLEARIGRSIHVVLQVGDFEPHRDEADLRTMAAPAKYKQLGDYCSVNLVHWA